MLDNDFNCICIIMWYMYILYMYVPLWMLCWKMIWFELYLYPILPCPLSWSYPTQSLVLPCPGPILPCPLSYLVLVLSYPVPCPTLSWCGGPVHLHLLPHDRSEQCWFKDHSNSIELQGCMYSWKFTPPHFFLGF